MCGKPASGRQRLINSSSKNRRSPDPHSSCSFALSLYRFFSSSLPFPLTLSLALSRVCFIPKRRRSALLKKCFTSLWHSTHCALSSLFIFHRVTRFYLSVRNVGFIVRTSLTLFKCIENDDALFTSIVRVLVTWSRRRFAQSLLDFNFNVLIKIIVFVWWKLCLKYILHVH